MKAMAYGTFETLRQKNAVLRETVKLNSGIQLAAWYNNLDTITVQSDHHTLSLYIADGYESYQKTPHGWKNGSGPDRFCLMPKGDRAPGIFAATSLLSIFTAPMNISALRQASRFGTVVRLRSRCRKKPFPAMTKLPLSIASFCWTTTGSSRRTTLR